MPTIYPSSIINLRLQPVLNAIDGGPSNGVLRILDSGGNILSSITLTKPSGSISGGVIAFGGLPLVDDSASASGFATTARIENSVGNVVASGLTVGQGVGVDVVLSNGLGTTFITAGHSVSLTAATLTGH